LQNVDHNFGRETRVPTMEGVESLEKNIIKKKSRHLGKDRLDPETVRKGRETAVNGSDQNLKKKKRVRR